MVTRNTWALTGALLLALAVSGCITTMANLSPDHQTRIKERIIPADYDTVFGVVVDVLAEDGYDIKVEDKGKGIIKTDSSLQYTPFTDNSCNPFTPLLLNPLGAHWRTISAHLEKDKPARTKLTLDVLAETSPFYPFTDWKHYDSLVKPSAYDKWFLVIESRARLTAKQD